MNVQELEQAVSRLSLAEFVQFAEWFAAYQQDIWDKQIAEDVKAGRLDRLIAQAHREFEAGRCRVL